MSQMIPGSKEQRWGYKHYWIMAYLVLNKRYVHEYTRKASNSVCWEKMFILKITEKQNPSNLKHFQPKYLQYNDILNILNLSNK